MAAGLDWSADSKGWLLASMCAMTRPRDTPTAAPGAEPVFPTPLRAGLLWSGAVLCAAGLVWSRAWEHWAPGRFAELLVLSLLSMGCAWPLRRFVRWSWATALAAVWLAALPVFAGPLPVLAVALVAAAAMALGGLVTGAVPVALAAACGLVLLAGALGWLLPLPVHTRWTYLALCMGLIALGRRPLTVQLQSLRRNWADAVAAQPRAAALAVLFLGLASTGCWLPTMQFDDLAYHLGLPWQLMQEGRYVLDPTHQVWALAPWAADVQQALPQLIAGREARGPLNALWIAITGAALWHLCAELGATPRTRWAAVALYASLPLTAGLAAGMQTETPATALLVWLAWLVMRRPALQGAHPLLAGAVLVGGLVGLKLMGAAYAAIVLVWAAIEHRPWPRPGALLAATALAAGVGLSSYVYASVIAGNPFLPLFNAWFGSPYFAESNFDDPRWQAGFSPLLPWLLTFQTRSYAETMAGSAGFAMVALAGAWGFAFVQRDLRALAITASAALLLPLVPLQYLRYAFPASVLLLAVMVSASERMDQRKGHWLLLAVAVLGFAFQANGNWMQRTGALKQAVLAAGQDAPLLDEYAPERKLIAMLQRRNLSSEPVLVMDELAPNYAELGRRGRTTAWYAPTMQRAAAGADADSSGRQWQALLHREGVHDVILRPASLTPARAAGLRLAGARRQASVGAAEWWRLPDEAAQ